MITKLENNVWNEFNVDGSTKECLDDVLEILKCDSKLGQLSSIVGYVKGVSNVVEITCRLGIIIIKDGFTWGYNGTGPKGLETLLTELGMEGRLDVCNLRLESKWRLSPNLSLLEQWELR